MWIVDSGIGAQVVEMDLVNNPTERQMFDNFYSFHESSYLDCETEFEGVYAFFHINRTVYLSEDPIALATYIEREVGVAA